MTHFDLQHFNPISLDQMDDVKLMKRMDVKFVLNTNGIHELLDNLKHDYRILEIDGNRMMTYDSQYFDTNDFKFYLDHHNQVAKRTKIRIRNYVESNLSFLEVKQKDAKGQTVKRRTAVNQMSTNISKSGLTFIHEVTKINFNITPTLSNRFNRFTLVSLENKERVTVDFNLSYNGELFNQRLAVVELKQEKLMRGSKLFLALKSKGIHPFSISKYCIGMATTNSTVKQNNFKHKLLTIKKRTQ